MDCSFDQAARVAREWAARPAVSDSNRTLCLIVSGMAEALKDASHVAGEDEDSFVLLGCELCRRMGEAECLCCSGVRPEHCPLGLAAIAGQALPPSWRSLQVSPLALGR